MRPNLSSAAWVAVLLSLISLDHANAGGGCGPGFHRNPYGACRPNGPVVVAPAAPVVVAPAACGAGFRWHPRWRRCIVL
jgi:hypothetical protein